MTNGDGADGPRWRILNAEPDGYSEKAAQRLRALGELVEEAVPAGGLAERLADFDAVIVRLGHRVGADELAAGRRLRCVVTATTGLDHIDLEAAERHGVAVLSLRGELDFLRTIRATGEHTWALLLALVRNLPAACADVDTGGWDRERFRGRELSGKRLGILGLGRVGEQIAAYGRAFEMDVAAFDPYRSDDVDGVRRFATRSELLRWSEILTVHLPLSEETRGSLDREALAELPRGALLVNTARGELVDEAALVELLRQGHLGGAAVDVVRHERQPDERRRSPLLEYARRHGNLLVTPHLGGATWESMHRTEEFMAEKLCRFLARPEVAEPR